MEKKPRAAPNQGALHGAFLLQNCDHGSDEKRLCDGNRSPDRRRIGLIIPVSSSRAWQPRAIRSKSRFQYR